MTIVDARPILRRTDDNLWDRTENLRSELYRLVEDTCLKLGLEALVLQSDPYVHPAWVKVESWKPERGGALTARSSMMVTITAMPYHLYEAVYKVEWEKQGRSGVKDHLYAFREHEVTQMLRLLLTGPGLPPFGDGEVKWILGSVQLRTEWWHIWKPRNKVVALRRDRVRVASGLLIAAGVAVTLGGLATQSGGFEDGGFRDGGYDPGMEDTTAVVAPTTDTVAASLYPDTMAVVVPTTDSVVTTIAVDTIMAPTSPSTNRSIYAGQEVAAVLGVSDPVFYGTTAHYGDWRYTSYGSERIVVTMSSSDFTPYLTVGQYVDSRWTTVSSPDNTVTDQLTFSRVEVWLPAAGEYVIAAGSTLPDRTGSYTLRLDPVGATP